jgi:glycosyltransferase involved in cell wall biosynthesis
VRTSYGAPVPDHPVVAVNTLSVSNANEGTRTMLGHLLPALARVAPELRQVLICSRANRALFDGGGEIIEVEVDERQKLRRIYLDQFRVPRLARSRADLLLNAAGVPSLITSLPQVLIVSAHLALPSCARVAGHEGFNRWHRFYYGLPFRLGLRKSRAVLGISSFLADGLVTELGVDRRKVTAMPLGVRPPDRSPRTEGRQPLVLFVGTLYGYKDAVVAVRAFGQAADRLPAGARLAIAGKDFEGQIDRVRQAAADAGVAGTVDVLGAISDAELEDLYGRASALVLPSRCEGFGLPVAEAMSRGLPVIVARATSLPEVVGDAGILVEPGDVPGFAEAMVDVLTDPTRQATMATLGLTRAAELNWDATARCLRDALMAVYSGVA